RLIVPSSLTNARNINVETGRSASRWGGCREPPWSSATLFLWTASPRVPSLGPSLAGIPPMPTSESGFINDIKEIATRGATSEQRRQAAEARFRQLERELERAYLGHPQAQRHIDSELADLRRAMLIELDRDPPPTLGSLLDKLLQLSR